MKQVLVIGDVHGKSDWIRWATEAFKQGIEVVFLGDYVDSFNIEPREIEQNLLRIISFKKKADARKNFITKVSLLLGNHDYAYIIGKSNTSGYKVVWAERYREIFNKNWKLFDLAWGYTDLSTHEYTLITHAGLTNDYWNKYVCNPERDEYQFVKTILGVNAFAQPQAHQPIHMVLNILKDKFGLIWRVGGMRGGIGTPGIIWADIAELKFDPFIGINQIVGHTGWHSPEFLRINGNNNFILKIDGNGSEVQRMVVNL